MENKKASILFYICNSLNAVLCFLAISPLSHWHPLLPLIMPYLYFVVRIYLYRIWYIFGYHPLARRRYYSGPKGGMHLPVFTKTTDDYRQLRQKQSLKYQTIYNIYKIVYRSVYFTFLFVMLSLFINRFFTADNRYPGSPLQAFLINLSGGVEAIEKLIFVALILLAFYFFFGIYKLGKLIWQSHFYKRYPVTVLLVERDEPILSAKESEQSSILV